MGVETNTENHNTFFENVIWSSSQRDVDLCKPKRNHATQNRVAISAVSASSPMVVPSSTHNESPNQSNGDCLRTETSPSPNPANNNALDKNVITKTIHDASLNEEINGVLEHNSSSFAKHASKETNEAILSMLQKLIVKFSAMEDFMIRLSIKIDMIRQNDLQSERVSKDKYIAIDISQLTELGLPAESQETVEKLEEDLKNAEFKSKLASYQNNHSIFELSTYKSHTLQLCQFFQSVIMSNLDDGESSSVDILERLMLFLISPSFLPHVSWTGRGKGKKRKFALNACIHLINFIVLTMNKIDKRYNNKKIEKDITYVILKRAPFKYGKSKKSDPKVNPTPSKEASTLEEPTVQALNNTSGTVADDVKVTDQLNGAVLKTSASSSSLKVTADSSGATNINSHLPDNSHMTRYIPAQDISAMHRHQLAPHYWSPYVYPPMRP